MSETPHDFPLPEDNSIQPVASESPQEMVFPDLTPVETAPEPGADPLPELALTEAAPSAAAVTGEKQPATRQKYTPAVLAMIAIGLLIALCCLMAFVVTALVLPAARAGGV